MGIKKPKISSILLISGVTLLIVGIFLFGFLAPVQNPESFTSPLSSGVSSLLYLLHVKDNSNIQASQKANVQSKASPVFSGVTPTSNKLTPGDILKINARLYDIASKIKSPTVFSSGLVLGKKIEVPPGTCIGLKQYYLPQSIPSYVEGYILSATPADQVPGNKEAGKIYLTIGNEKSQPLFVVAIYAVNDVGRNMASELANYGVSSKNKYFGSYTFCGSITDPATQYEYNDKTLSFQSTQEIISFSSTIGNKRPVRIFLTPTYELHSLIDQNNVPVALVIKPL